MTQEKGRKEYELYGSRHGNSDAFETARLKAKKMTSQDYDLIRQLYTDPQLSFRAAFN